MLLHVLFISNLAFLKKKNEVYVVNLSEFQEFKFSEPVQEPKPLIKKPKQLSQKK